MKHLCEKRIVTCVLLDHRDMVLAVGVNQCDAPDGCRRMDKKTVKRDYSTATECNSIHAEMDALSRLHKNVRPYRAIISGHDFACSECETTLRLAGVEHIEIWSPIATRVA